MTRNAIIISLLFVFCPAFFFQAEAHDQSYRVDFGTLEKGPSLQSAYIFRSESHQEIFSLDVFANSGLEFPGLPDLAEVGFQTASGRRVRYGKESRREFLMRFSKEHPQEQAIALIFEGKLSEELVIQLKGLTPVCRVQIQTNGTKVNLWKNLPNK